MSGVGVCYWCTMGANKAEASPLWARGSVAHTLYLWIAQKQDGSSNQCISIYMVVSLPGNKC